MVCITSSHITTITQRGVSRHISTNTPLHNKCNKVVLLPCVFACLSILTFSQYDSQASYARQLNLVALSILASPPDSPCSEETTRLHWRVSFTQLHSSYCQGLVISYRPTTLIYSPSGGMSRSTLSGLNGFTEQSFCYLIYRARHLVKSEIH